MAHPENGTLVPACVQHSVLDPAENAQLRTLLPIVDVRSRVDRPSRTASSTSSTPSTTKEK
jgi:hypothetical protein